MKTLSMAIIFLWCLWVGIGAAEEVKWEKGGPSFLYVKPTKKPPHHGVYDESMKCLDCHSYDGVDAYTSATMAMKKSVKGRMPQQEIAQAIAEALKGRGDYREIYVLSTSFNNKPLATVVELVLDPKTFTFYAMSERQTEKLFHIASNPQVSAAYVKQRENYDYFTGALGVQIVGKATLLHDDDPEFVAAARIYLPTLPQPVPTGIQPPPIDDMIAMIKHTKIITKITPERIVILNRAFKAKGYHAVQVWEAGAQQ
ncbi:MAG: pyridoxamine 5'-phosphate oxidase family protein [Desulfobacterota bacterium]|nr:pyridoxamine 5'-phosphate oxidase family protein [Thermodesulfobacteriota bacterium]